MPDRYWVGGTANWDSTAGTKWAATSGGAGGASVPTSADDVFFDAASGAITCTVGGFQPCANLTFTGFTGTISSTAFGVLIYGNLTLSSAMTITGAAFAWNFESTTTGRTVTSNGKAITGNVAFRGVGGGWSLNDAISISGAFVVTNGTFTTNNFNVTAISLSSSNSNIRTINLGSSTVTLSGSGASLNFLSQTNLTFNAGTSSIVLSSNSGAITVGTGVTFYNVSWTGTANTTPSIQGANTFNNLSVAGRTSTGITNFRIDANQTINGTLTLSAGTNATMRTFVRSDTIGTTRTLTCAAFSGTDADFRDITIAGAAAPVSGTRLGDCKGNSGITFPAAKTVYWREPSSLVWGSGSSCWSLTAGGSFDINAFPLAQDTAVFTSTYPNSGATITVNAAYNIGTIDMSARTSNTMTLATGSTTPSIYGSWINGTGTTLTGTGETTFAGRTTQTITSAGKTFTQRPTVNSPGGTVIQADAFVCDRSFTNAITLTLGTWDCNGYNLTLSGANSGFVVTGSGAKSIAIGSGTLTIAGSAGWVTSGGTTGFTVAGTGTISLTNASAKPFQGGGIQTYPTLNQGGTGALTVTGSNKFANITNTAIGSVLFTGGTTNEFGAFNLNGTSTAARLTLGSTNTTQAIIRKPSAWNVGTGSLDGGNNTGLSFVAGGNDFLSVSYINGVVVASASQVFYGSTNVTNIRYGSTPVSAIYYGSTKVF